MKIRWKELSGTLPPGMRGGLEFAGIGLAAEGEIDGAGGHLVEGLAEGGEGGSGHRGVGGVVDADDLDLGGDGEAGELACLDGDEGGGIVDANDGVDVPVQEELLDAGGIEGPLG